MAQLETKILRPVIAFLIAACVTAAIPAVVITFFPVIEPPPGSIRPVSYRLVEAVIVVFPMNAAAIIVFSTLPFLAGIQLLKLLRLPRGFGDALVGGIIAVAGASIAKFVFENDFAWEFLIFLLPAGLVFGLTYWLAAGRPVRSRPVAAR